jgi:phosphatidylglycerol:prolipoprotein diacylglycerol transferase
MHHTLIQIGPLALRSYGLMLAISFLLGIWLVQRRGERIGLDFQKTIDLVVVIIIASIIGSRALYVVFHLDEFSAHPLDIINPFQSSGEVGIQGLSMDGGVILSIIVSLWFLRRHRLPVWKVADVVAPSIALGVSLTRIGCFLNGCCFGKPGDLPWCVVFPSDTAAGWYFSGIAVHPTQLYASLYGLLIFMLLLIVERHKMFDGFLFWFFIAIYSVCRFAFDFVRFYEAEQVIVVGGLSLSVSHFINAGMGLLALCMLWYLRGRSRA